MKTAQDYFGLSFTDIYSKTITLTHEGILVSRTKGLGHKFNRTIPYQSVRGINNHPARAFSAGFFSVLTTVGGVVQASSLFSAEQASAVAEDESSFAYRKKHAETIQKIIDAINYLKENASVLNHDPLAEYWGMTFKGIFGKKILLAKDGVHLSKGSFSKVIPYANIFDVYMRMPETSADSGIFSIVENTGLTACKKLEILETASAATFLKDENSIHFAKNGKNELEKIYYAIELIRRSHCSGALYTKAAERDFGTEIDGMDGHEFEYFCADILKNNNFTDVRVTKGSGDQGVDVLATKDGIKYAVQCKNYSSTLGNTPVQEVNAGKTFYGCHVGVVMTNSTFTSGAKELAQATGVLLWDREVLQRMMDTST